MLPQFLATLPVFVGQFADFPDSTVDEMPDDAARPPNGMLFDHEGRAARYPVWQRQRLGHLRHPQLYSEQMQYVLAPVVERLLFVARFTNENGRCWPFPA